MMIPESDQQLRLRTNVLVLDQLTGFVSPILLDTEGPSTHVFAWDHPDARNAAINVMFEFTPAGERIRRPGLRTAAQH